MSLLFKSKLSVFVLVEEFDSVHDLDLLGIVHHVLFQELANLVRRELGFRACPMRALYSLKGGIRLIVGLAGGPLPLFFHNGLIL